MSRCLECKDTGWVGDIGPGIRGNHEYMPCDCMPAGADREAWLRSCVRACTGLKDPEREINLLVTLSCDLINLLKIDPKLSEQDFADELRRRLENLEGPLKPFLEMDNNG